MRICRRRRRKLTRGIRRGARQAANGELLPELLELPNELVQVDLQRARLMGRPPAAALARILRMLGGRRRLADTGRARAL